MEINQRKEVNIHEGNKYAIQTERVYFDQALKDRLPDCLKPEPEIEEVEISSDEELSALTIKLHKENEEAKIKAESLEFSSYRVKTLILL